MPQSSHGAGRFIYPASVAEVLKRTIGTIDWLATAHCGQNPTVYLDHWALREWSTTPGLADRFVAALKKRKGTLALSYANLIFRGHHAVECGAVLGAVKTASLRSAAAFRGASGLDRAFSA